MLGHSTTRLVQERYGHSLPTGHRDACLAIDRALRSEPRPSK